MGLVIRHSIWNSVIQYVGIVLGYINTVLLFPKYLDADEYGLTRILLFVTIVICQFAQFGTPSMVIRFFPHFRKKVLPLGLWICSAGLVIFLGMLFLLKGPVTGFYAEKSALFVNYFYLLIPFTISMVFYNLFDAYLKALYKNVLSASMPFIVLRLLWMGLIILYAMGTLDFEQFIIAYAWSYTLIAFFTLSYILLIKALPDNWTIEGEQRRQLGFITNFNTFNILSGISSFMITKVDVLMLGGYEGLRIVAIYTIAASMASVIRVPSAAIARTAPSLIAQAFKNNALSQIDELYKKSAVNQFIMSSLVFVLIVLNFDLLLSFLPPEYASSFILFLYLGLAQVVDTGVGINGYIMVNSKFYKVDAVLSILLLVITVVTNMIFIPLLGATGAALATFLSIAIYNVLRWAFLQIRMHLNPFTRKNFIALLVFLIPTGAIWFLPMIGSIWIDSFIKSALVFLLIVPGIYFMNISPEINGLIRKGIRSVGIRGI